MKTQIENYILEIQKQLNIPVKMNIGASDSLIHGSVTVGDFGFMLYGTWQPKDDTTFQFKIESETGNVFDYETNFVNNRPVLNIVYYGHYTEFFKTKIENSIKGCIGYCVDSKVNKYKSALNKIQKNESAN